LIIRSFFTTSCGLYILNVLSPMWSWILYQHSTFLQKISFFYQNLVRIRLYC